MKKILFNIGCAFAATLLLGACSDTETLVDNVVTNNGETPENAIAFSTYMGKSGQETRAGYEGSMTTERLKDFGLTNGFGVFAYYTPLNTDKYTYWNSIDNATDKHVLNTNYTSSREPNFMYNQQVKWNNGLDNSYITKWTYSPIKYWPNDFQNGAVDDQPNDQATDPAKGSGQYGHVSFFAYAPYVFFTPTNGKEKAASATDGYDVESTQKGTVGQGITNVTTNAANGDPIIDYVMATDGKNVDLLWGTADNTSVNVVGTAQAGSYTGYGTLTSDTYENASKYPVNINLTKQTTGGTINFAFKHALAKVGGSPNPNLPSTVQNGLMVVLDLDDMRGAETGGEIEIKDGKVLTKVTIKEIKITNDLNGDGTVKDDVNTDPKEWAKNKGQLNLATGEWGNVEAAKNSEDASNVITHIIANTSASPSAELNTLLDENTFDADGSTGGIQKNANWFTVGAAAHTGSPGVTTEPQNVYKEETSPLVFFPGTTPKLLFQIDYIVRTYDENLKKGYSEVEQVIKKVITLPELEMNKQYNILIHLGLTSVKFTASVSDWDIDRESTDTDLDNELDLKVEDVYLPINVGSLVTTYTSTQMASTVNTFTASAQFFGQNGGTDVTPTYSLENVTPAGWITVSGTTFTISANESFANRTATINASYTPAGGSQAHTTTTNIIQYGRIPSSAVLTFTTTPTLTNIAAAGSTVAGALGTNVTKATITYKEADSNGSATGDNATKDVTTGITYAYLDDTTGKTATWVNTSTDDIVVNANTTSKARSATLYIQVDGKYIPTTTKITQN